MKKKKDFIIYFKYHITMLLNPFGALTMQFLSPFCAILFSWRYLFHYDEVYISDTDNVQTCLAIGTLDTGGH